MSTSPLVSFVILSPDGDVLAGGLGRTPVLMFSDTERLSAGSREYRRSRLLGSGEPQVTANGDQVLVEVPGLLEQVTPDDILADPDPVTAPSSIGRLVVPTQHLSFDCHPGSLAEVMRKLTAAGAGVWCAGEPVTYPGHVRLGTDVSDRTLYSVLGEPLSDSLSGLKDYA